MARSPPAARGVRVRVPSCACVMLLTMARPRPTPARSVRMRPVSAKKRLGKRGDYLWGELLAGVLDGELHTLGVSVGRDPHGAVSREVVDDRVLHEVRRHLQQERVRPDGGGDVAGGLDREAAFLCEGEECLGGFFGDEGEVDGSRVKDCWSARLSRSKASVRSIARVLTAWRRSTSSPVSRFGSLLATSSSVCVIASGVRSS